MVEVASRKSGRIAPFLSQFAVARTGGSEMIGRFSSQLDVWVIDGADGVSPIVEVKSDVGETVTITRVRAEIDDTDVNPFMEAGTRTSTAVRAEVDDHDLAASTYLRITTKTDAQIERDDVVEGLEAYEPQATEEASVRAISIR